MPWKFVCELRDFMKFYKQTKIIRQITKENEEIEKYKNCSNCVQIFMYINLCMCLCGL